MIYKPECKFVKNTFPFFSDQITPFNSQNTIINRNVFKDYFYFLTLVEWMTYGQAFMLQVKNTKWFMLNLLYIKKKCARPYKRFQTRVYRIC